MNPNILITGTSSGIGHALAKAYLAEGGQVFGLSRRNADDLADFEKYAHAQVDLANFANIPHALRELLQGVEKLDLVILNAGIIGRIADLAETPVEELKQTLDVNLWSNKVLIDELYRTGKRIAQVVAISSGAASSAQRGWNGYSISKAALNMLIGLYAAEHPETHFSSVAPGIVDTRMQAYIAGLPEDPKYSSLAMLRQARGTPMMPKAAEVAEPLMIAFDKVQKEPSGIFTDFGTLLRKR